MAKKPSPTSEWTAPVSNKGNYFKPEYGLKYRIHMLNVPTGGAVHYVQGVGYVHSDSVRNERGRITTRGEVDNYLTTDPALRYIAQVVVYETDKNGQITGSAAKVGFDVKTWSFGPNIYQQLFDLQIEYGDDLLNQDFIVTVAQKGTMVFPDKVTVAAKGALSADATLGKRINDEYDPNLTTEAMVSKLLGQILTLAELQEKMAGKGDKPATGTRNLRQ